MKLQKSALALCLLAGITSCSKPKPAHPKVGITVKGFIDFTCPFYRKEGGKLLHNPGEMNSVENDHSFKLIWSVDPQGSSDAYHLRITVDSFTSEHDITYSGTPVVVMEKPVRIVVGDIP